MKIARIKEIKNVGVFSDYQNGGQLGFEKLTFIYGLNTYGKTTLADIFQSIKDDDPNLIQDRKTIPAKQSQQKVVIGIKENNIEKDLKFDNSSWEENGLSQNLEVFRTDFIHKYLFTGLTIERSNKEEFTQFVLGEKGVKIAQNIAQNKKKLGDMRRGIKDKVPEYLKDKVPESEYVKGYKSQEIKKFLEFNKKKIDKDDIVEKLIKFKEQKKEEENRLQEPEKIFNIQDIDDFEVPEINVAEVLDVINEILQKDYSDIEDKVVQNIEQHIKSSFKDKESAEAWIRQGFPKCKDHKNGSCVFCGQSLQGAKDLMVAYEKYFNEAYSDFINKTESDLLENLNKLKGINFSSKDNAQSLQIVALKYKDLIEQDGFQDALNQLDKKIKKLDADALFKAKKQIVEEIEEKIESKNKQPHSKVEEVSFSDFKEKVKEYKTTLQEISNLISKIKESIKKFKKQYENTGDVKKKIKSLEEKITKLGREKARIEQDEDCRKYIEELEEIDKLTKQIAEEEKQLKTDQSEYLENYFSEIDDLFKKLGSYNFTLEKSSGRRGHQPVYSLKVKYYGEEVSSNNLEKVFSESDRRALALAVFWAKIKLKDNDKKENTVVVLDDPVTSFDDNRIINSISLFKNSLDNLSQIIVLTHYPHFIKNFCERVQEAQVTTKFFELERNDTTSYLKDTDRNTFTQSDYVRVYTKIYGFINREHDDDIRTDLRKFLESLYMPVMFADGIKQAEKDEEDISSLENLIDVVITEDNVKDKFHEFRQSLNPDSHIFTSSNTEDVRNFARGMMEYLYSFSFNNTNYDQT